MSSYTLGKIILIFSSLVLVYSAFTYRRWYKNGELAKLSIGQKIQGILIWSFWITAFVGSILLLQEKEMSRTVLSRASYLLLFGVFSQLISSLIRFFKGDSDESEDVKESENEEDETIPKLVQPTILMTSIQFVIALALVLWFQNWLGTPLF